MFPGRTSSTNFVDELKNRFAAPDNRRDSRSSSDSSLPGRLEVLFCLDDGKLDPPWSADWRTDPSFLPDDWVDPDNPREAPDGPFGLFPVFVGRPLSDD